MQEPLLRILGPIEIRHGTHSGPLRGAKPSALLTALLLQPGRVVSIETLMDALWAGEPPRSAVANLRSYAHLLRRRLPASTPLISHQGGYELRAGPDAADHLVFERLADRGRAAVSADPPRAVELLTTALALWSSDHAAPGVERYGMLDGPLRVLDAERVRATEDLAGAWLGMGRPHSALRTAGQVLATEPLRIRSWLLVLSAHHDLGEPGRVTDAFESARTVFRRELGTEPDPSLGRLHRQLLAG
ncbi:BTAD domain-containing putative transcriptional regulator [Kitasatospora misakiensis]|uniref:BTAD domain-containing putative transcriptional regulator n=1 Tax=Kitasatospora misakiensis TaxID=67330 RepID=A0ABW0WZQ0_9ACTN